MKKARVKFHSTDKDGTKTAVKRPSRNDTNRGSRGGSSPSRGREKIQDSIRHNEHFRNIIPGGIHEQQGRIQKTKSRNDEDDD